MRKPHPRSLYALLQPLEPRQLLTAVLDPSTRTLMLAGNAGAYNDAIAVEMAGANYRVTINGVISTFPFADVDAISVNCGEGDDFVGVYQTEAPIEIFGYGGSDTVDVAGASDSLDWVAGKVHVHGGGGTLDKIVLHDGAAIAGNTFNFFFNAVSRDGWAAGPMLFDATDLIEVYGGAGNDTFRVTQSSAGVNYRAYGGGGSDSAHIGDANTGLEYVSGNFFFRGDAGYDVVHVHDAYYLGTALSDLYTVASTYVDRTGGSFGLINYEEPEKVILDAQSGDNEIQLRGHDAMMTAFEINGGGGNDTCIVGHLFGRLSWINGHVSFDGQAGEDSAVVVDAYASTAQEYLFDSQSLTTPTAGSEFGGFSWGNVEDVTLYGGHHGNTVTVLHTVLGVPTHINTGNGDDVVTIGDGFLDHLPGAVHLDTGDGTDSLTVDDESEDFAFNDAYTITADHLTRTYFGGLEFHNVEWSYLHASRGNNLINVDGGSLFHVWVLQGGWGDDTFIVGGATRVMDDVQGSFSFLGGVGVNHLTLDDSLAVTASAWRLEAGYLVRSPGQNAEPVNVIEFDDLATLTIEGGRAADIFDVNGTLSYTSTILRGGGGTAQPATGIDGIWINETDPNAPVTLLPNLGAKAAVAVNADGGGTATVRFTASQSLHALTIGGGGRAILAPGAGICLRLSGIPSFFDGGVLDVADNDLIIDYSGASPLGSPIGGGNYSGVLGHVQRGRNGGDWNSPGGGIITSRPDAATGLTTLAVTEASTAFGITGNQTVAFAGATVDATTIVIKYTYTGDVNLDGVVSGDDYSAIDFAILVPGAHDYANGDFNYDGVITGDDYSAIDFALLAQGQPF